MILGLKLSQRNRYRRLVNYDGLYAVMSTFGEKTERDKDGQIVVVGEKEFLIVLPLLTFLNFFSNPVDVHDLFLDKGRQICGEWNKINGGAHMLGHRNPVSVTYCLSKFEWKTNRGRPNERVDSSYFTIQLTSWGFTINSQQIMQPNITLKDVRVKFSTFIFRENESNVRFFSQVYIKLKSSGFKGADNSPSFDGYGFGVDLPHFLALLTSPEFASYVGDVRKIVDNLEVGKISNEEGALVIDSQ
jgi:hypothetical protein